MNRAFKMTRRWPLLAALLLAACADLRGSFTAMFQLQRGISETFGEPNTSINVASGGAMTVTFVNSDFAGLPEAERARRAAEVARYVARHWPREQVLGSLSIGFTSKHGVSGLTLSSTSTPYIYTKVQLDEMRRDTLPAAIDTLPIPDTTSAGSGIS